MTTNTMVINLANNGSWTDNPKTQALEADTNRPLFFTCKTLFGSSGLAKSFAWYLSFTSEDVEEDESAEVNSSPSARFQNLTLKYDDETTQDLTEKSGEVFAESVSRYDSDTTKSWLQQQIELELVEIITRARYEDFEDGFDSKFSQNLAELLSKYGELALKSFEQWSSTSCPKDIDVLMEAFRFFGRYEDIATKSYRFKLLTNGLKDQSPFIRDSAALGLYRMGDAAAIPYLKEAVEHEPFNSLREDFKQLVQQLQE